MLKRKEVDEWTGPEHKVKRIFGNWVCWPKHFNKIGNFWAITFAYCGKYTVNNGFAYIDENGRLISPNDWGCKLPARMVKYIEHELIHG